MSTRGAVLVVLVTALGLAVASVAFPGVPSRAGTARAMYVIGDSWTTGYGADPRRAWAEDAAQQLGLRLQLDAVDGTGYLNPGGFPGDTYVDRARAIPAGASADLVVLQGGSNDVTEDLANLRPAVEATVLAVRARFGAARIVILGPGWDVRPEPSTYRTVDATLAAVAQEDHVRYVSMLGERWITASNFSDVIDPSTAHPSIRGHSYLASRFVEDVAGMGFPRSAAAGGRLPTRSTTEQPAGQSAGAGP